MAIIALGWRERASKKGVTGRVTHGLTLDLELRPGALMCPWEISVGDITSGLLPVTKGKLLLKISPISRPNSGWLPYLAKTHCTVTSNRASS
jgi:hypothetical protein